MDLLTPVKCRKVSSCIRFFAVIFLLCSCSSPATRATDQDLQKGPDTRTINAPFCETYTAAASALLELCYTIYQKDRDAGLLSGRNEKTECIDYHAECKTGNNNTGKGDCRSAFSPGPDRDVSVSVTGRDAASSVVRITTGSSEAFERIWSHIDKHISGDRGGASCKAAQQKPKPEPEPKVVPSPEPRPEPMIEKKSEKKSEKQVEKEKMEIKILFDSGDWKISPNYLDEVKKAADMLKNNPGAAAEIQGHTDSVGSEQYNLKLSQKRSEIVRRTLVEKFGIDASRLTTREYGKSSPAADNNNAQGRQANRRTVILFYLDKQ